MKSILLFIVLFVPSIALASEPEFDKGLHFTVACASTLLVNRVVENPVASFVLVNIAGIAKEVLIDKKPDRRDIGANLLGSGLAVVVLFTF